MVAENKTDDNQWEWIGQKCPNCGAPNTIVEDRRECPQESVFKIIREQEREACARLVEGMIVDRPTPGGEDEVCNGTLLDAAKAIRARGEDEK